jgi:ribosome-associated toxin RatA of RatAB toxin-antitoxin module
MEMFNLVNDVRAYPSYIPMCSEVKLLEESPNKLKATITIAKSKVKLSFTTENTMEPGKSIRMRLVLLGMAFGGLFKEVTGSMVEAFCRQASRKHGSTA